MVGIRFKEERISSLKFWLILIEWLQRFFFGINLRFKLGVPMFDMIRKHDTNMT